MSAGDPVHSTCVAVIRSAVTSAEAVRAIAWGRDTPLTPSGKTLPGGIAPGTARGATIAMEAGDHSAGSAATRTSGPDVPHPASASSSQVPRVTFPIGIGSILVVT